MHCCSQPLLCSVLCSPLPLPPAGPGCGAWTSHQTTDNVVARVCSPHTPRYRGPLVTHAAGRTKQGDPTQDRTMHFVHFEPSQDRADIWRIPVLFVSSHWPRNVSQIALTAMPSAGLQRASPCTHVPAQQVSTVPPARNSCRPCRLSTGTAWPCVRRRLRSETRLSPRQTPFRWLRPFSRRS